MHESQNASEATNWEVRDLSSLIRLRNADLNLTASPFGDGLRFSLLLRFFTEGERRCGRKSNSAKEPVPHLITFSRMNSLIRFRFHGIVKKYIQISYNSHHFWTFLHRSVKFRRGGIHPQSEMRSCFQRNNLTTHHQNSCTDMIPKSALLVHFTHIQRLYSLVERRSPPLRCTFFAPLRSRGRPRRCPRSAW